MERKKVPCGTFWKDDMGPEKLLFIFFCLYGGTIQRRKFGALQGIIFSGNSAKNLPY
jgi:hypothetical protein